MTRMRDNRSDWDTFTPAKRARVAAAQKALYNGTQSLTAEERKLLDQPPQGERARPVQREQAEARKLAALVHRRWYRHGFTRIEHRTSNWKEGEGRLMEGAQTGMPDFWLFIPGEIRPSVRAVCELKAPEHRPKREIDSAYWWLDAWPEGQASWYGLRRDQWRWLWLLNQCGFHTFVAYGADEALEFFDAVAGDEPAGLPDWWKLR